MMPIADNPKLARYLAARLGGTDLTVRREWQNTEGWSMETFSLAVEYTRDGRRVEQEIILRREPVSGLLEPYDISIEYRILHALQSTGVAIPKTYWYEPDPDVFERPFYAMEKVAGQVHFVVQATDPDFRLIPDDQERASIAEDFVTNLARIHTCDWRALGLDFLGDPGPGTGSAMRQTAHWEDVIRRAGYGRKPLITLAINWLKDNAPENDTVRLVHTDYRTGNYIYRDKRISAVLDWEMAHLGDPHEDLVNILNPMWRSAPPDNWVNHLLPEEAFLERYEELSGIKVEPQKMAYYKVFNDLRSVGILTNAIQAFTAGRTKDLRPGVIGTLLDLACAGLAQNLARNFKS